MITFRQESCSHHAPCWLQPLRMSCPPSVEGTLYTNSRATAIAGTWARQPRGCCQGWRSTSRCTSETTPDSRKYLAQLLTGIFETMTISAYILLMIVFRFWVLGEMTFIWLKKLKIVFKTFSLKKASSVKLKYGKRIHTRTKVWLFSHLFQNKI